MYSQRKSLKPDHFLFAVCVDCAFSLQDQAKFVTLADTDAPLPWIPADLLRWMEEYPDSVTGSGKFEKLVLEAICSGVVIPYQPDHRWRGAI
ncbi:hypothetical protein [Desulfobacter vibrioformis]|uniref:hypothetical protein n=1 Tax=Desulfobacter vibrioformis TaxID=34031 RepID=UPI001B80B858|nr:hypothetical protein [Desulfobacter vibrioformis]